MREKLVFVMIFNFSSSMEFFLPLLRISASYFANPARLHAERAGDREAKVPQGEISSKIVDNAEEIS